jgi:integrase
VAVHGRSRLGNGDSGSNPRLLAGSGTPDDHVFTAPEGGPLRIVGFRNRIWRPATKAAGVEGLRIHDLRHTAVALWIAAGASPKEVAVRAGHTSVSFTLDRYGHLYPETDAKLRDRLDDLDDLHATARPPEGLIVDLTTPTRG